MSREKLIDTHTHIFVSEFDADRKSVLHSAREVCSALILPNIDWESVALVNEVCASYPDFCYPAIGLHPSSVPENPTELLSRFEEILMTQKWIGIGETGLDLYWDKNTLPQQIISLNKHCEWAKDMNLPLILHTRDAIPETIELIKKNQNGNLRGVFHCFTGTEQEAQEIFDLGFYIGLGGVLTYPKSNMREVVKNLDRNRIVLETDSPWLPPVPHRGKRNESSFIKYTAEALAQAWFISIDDVAKITSQNAKQLFFNR